MRGLYQANIDLGILQEIKITNGLYMHLLVGFRVVVTNASSRHSRGVVLFYQELRSFVVEAL